MHLLGGFGGLLWLFWGFLLDPRVNGLFWRCFSALKLQMQKCWIFSVLAWDAEAGRFFSQVSPCSPFIAITSTWKEILTIISFFVPGSVKTHKYSNMYLWHNRLKSSNFRLFNAFCGFEKCLVFIHIYTVAGFLMRYATDVEGTQASAGQLHTE